MDIGDALFALRLAVGLETFSSQHLITGDLNGDGRIDSADAVMLQRLVTGFDQVNPPTPRDDYSDPLLLANIVESGVPIAISVDDEQASVGGAVDVPIRVSNAQGISGYDVILQFDPALLEVVEVREGTVTGAYPQSWRTGDGTVRISMGRREALYESGKSTVSATLAIVRFRVKAAPVEGDAIAVRIDGTPALKGQYGDSFAWYTRLNRVHGEIRLESNEGEGEVPVEGEISVEGEGEDEGENEGEGEPEDGGGCDCSLCSGRGSKTLHDWLGDWLLVGMAIVALSVFSREKRT